MYGYSHLLDHEVKEMNCEMYFDWSELQLKIDYMAANSSQCEQSIFGDCAVCLMPLDGPSHQPPVESQRNDAAATVSDPVGAIRCGHLFHATCILQALNTKDACPLCRATAKVSDVCIVRWKCNDATGSPNLINSLTRKLQQSAQRQLKDAEELSRLEDTYDRMIDQADAMKTCLIRDRGFERRALVWGARASQRLLAKTPKECDQLMQRISKMQQSVDLLQQTATAQRAILQSLPNKRKRRRSPTGDETFDHVRRWLRQVIAPPPRLPPTRV